MRGIIRYLSRCKRLKVRAYFPHFMKPSVSSLSSKFLPRFLKIYIYFYLIFSLFSVCWLGAPPAPAFLTPNLCSCKSALRKSLEEHLLLEAVQDPLSLSAGAPRGSR